jgi:exodeoxyribonuclease V alpha subunit
MVQRNDYERQLYNGDQGVVLRVERDGGAARLEVVFARRDALEAFPLDAGLDLAPAFAMTVHKAQGSEFDHVGLVLPEGDLPLLTRELLYTAITRARRSVVLVGDKELLARAVSRRIERYSGIAERLAGTHK